MLRPDDPRVALAFPGVRQDHLGQAYQEGRCQLGACFVDATDSRRFELSHGSFGQDTLHVVVTEPDGTQYRAGAMPFKAREAEASPRMPKMYYTRERGGIPRLVG